MLEPFLTQVRREVDAALAARLAEPSGDDPGRLGEAMRYAVLGGGKRLRPALAMAAAEAAGGLRAAALPAACAIELLHAYTLVHDDLPCMDDDDMRRGQPTVHVAFGEATAVLAGDGLLTAAFGCLAELGGRAADAVAVLASRSGAAWLLKGQSRDLSAGPPRAMDELERLHAEKTGALFAAATELGAIVAGADPGKRRALAGFGLALGVAFQHADDLADGDHDAFASEARERVSTLATQARELLAPFGPRGALLSAFVGWVEEMARP